METRQDAFPVDASEPEMASYPDPCLAKWAKYGFGGEPVRASYCARGVSATAWDCSSIEKMTWAGYVVSRKSASYWR